MLIMTIQPSISREKHVATNWWLYADPELTQVVKQSLNDTVNLTTKIFDDTDLDPDKTYYGVAQELFETYDAEPSRAAITRIKDNSSIVVNKDLPAAMPAPAPIITIDTNSVPGNFIPFTLPPIQSDSDAVCTAVDIVITDDKGKVYYKELYSNDTTGKTITTAALKPGKLYSLNIVQHASNGDVTPVGRAYFKVPNIKEFTVASLPDPKSVPEDEPYILILDVDDSIKFSTAQIVIYGATGPILNYLGTVNTNTLATVINKDYFNNAYDTYIFKITVTDTAGRTYGPLYVRAGLNT